MKKHLLRILEVVLLLIYVIVVYHISMNTPILAKMNYGGRWYIEYSLKSLIFFGAAAGIFAFVHDVIRLIIKARKEDKKDEF